MLACSCSLAWARTLSRAHRSPLSLVSLALWLWLSLSHSLSRSRTLSLARRLSRSLARSLARTVTHSISLSPALSLSYSLALCLALSHPRSLFLARSRIRSRSCARSLSPRSPSAPRRLPQQRPRPLATARLLASAAGAVATARLLSHSASPASSAAPSASNHGLPARGRRCHGAISAAVRGWASAFKQQLAKESTAASRVRVSWGKRWHTQPSSAPSGSSCGGRESTGCASTNRRDRSLTVLLTKFILSPQTDTHNSTHAVEG